MIGFWKVTRRLGKNSLGPYYTKKAQKELPWQENSSFNSSSSFSPFHPPHPFSFQASVTIEIKTREELMDKPDSILGSTLDVTV